MIVAYLRRSKQALSASSLIHDAIASGGVRNINAICSEPLNCVIKATVLSSKSTFRIRMLLNNSIQMLLNI
jgi:hypothetical protein